MAISLTRPKSLRIHATFVDPDKKKSRTFTVYNTSLGDLVGEFQEFLSAKERPARPIDNEHGRNDRRRAS